MHYTGHKAGKFLYDNLPWEIFVAKIKEQIYMSTNYIHQTQKYNNDIPLIGIMHKNSWKLSSQES